MFWEGDITRGRRKGAFIYAGCYPTLVLPPALKHEWEELPQCEFRASPGHHPVLHQQDREQYPVDAKIVLYVLESSIWARTEAAFWSDAPHDEGGIEEEGSRRTRNRVNRGRDVHIPTRRVPPPPNRRCASNQNR